MESALATWSWRLFWACVVGLTGLIVVNTLPYYSFRDDFAYLHEKGSLSMNTMWRSCFYVHIGGGILCLATGPVLLWTRSRPIHTNLGRLYGLAVLGLAGPAGIYLSLFAKGGLLGQSCFLLLALAWWGATAVAIYAITHRDVPRHRRWMLRSYALALSAVFFRIFQVGLHYAGFEAETNYVISLWLSLAASLIAGELFIFRGVSL
jgi:hypothetical protein